MDYTNEEQTVRELQYNELAEWLAAAELRADHINFIIKFLFQENLFSLDDILAVLPNNPNALPIKIGPGNIKKIIQALIDENLLPATSRAARSIQIDE
jgi:hypothetical protein